MKTYNQLIEAVDIDKVKPPSPLGVAVSSVFKSLKKRLRIYKRQSKYLETVQMIEKKYPGVNHFFLVASEWAEFVDPKKNPQLYKMLIELSEPTHLQDFSDDELRRVYKYIFKRQLKTHADMKKEFINAARNFEEWSGPDRRNIKGTYDTSYDGPERRESEDTKKLKSFGHFTYKGVDTDTMKKIHKKTGLLRKLSKHITLNNVLLLSTLLTTLSGLYMNFAKDKKWAEFAKSLRDLSEKVTNLTKAHQSGKDVSQSAQDLSDDINILLNRASNLAPPSGDDPLDGHSV